MKYFLLVCGLFFIPLSIVRSQEWQWAEHFTGDSIDAVYVISDNSNNIYVAGNFSRGTTGTVDIGTDQLTSDGNQDIFICSFDALDTYRWSVRIGGTLDDWVSAITIDESGNLYVVGYYKSDPINFTATDNLPNENKFDAFWAKYDSDNGSFLDAKRIFWGNDNEKILDITIDNGNSNLLMVGTFNKELVYDNGVLPNYDTLKADDPNVKENFISVYDFSGDYQKIKKYVSTMQKTTFKLVNLTNLGGYFITGDLQGDLGLNATDTIKGDQVNTDILVMRVDNNLDYVWARKGGGTGYDHVNSAGSDDNGNIYFTGKVEGQIIFDKNATEQSDPIDGFGLMDMYIGKYNMDGNLQWVTRNGSIGDDDGYGLAVSSDGVQFAGNYADTVIFNNDTLASSSTTDINTGFAIYDLNGVAIGAQELTGDGEDRGEGVVFDQTGNTYVIGYFTSTTFKAGTFNLNNATGTSDAFLVKYAYPFSIAETKHQDVSCNGGNNGEIIVTPHFGTPPFTYDWTPPVSTDSTASILSAGFYKVVVTDGFSNKDSLTIEIKQPDSLWVKLDSLLDVSCNAENEGTKNDGKIYITPKGGIETEPYVYQWSTSDGSGIVPGNEDQLTLTKGTYYLKLMDDNLCEAYDTFMVSQPDPINFAGTVVTNVTIPPGSNGAVDLNVTGGIAPYTYLWSNGAITEDISNLEGDVYSVDVTDFKGCLEDTSILVVDSTLLLCHIPDSSVSHVSCKSGDDGKLRVIVTGGSDDYKYEWEDALGNPRGGNFPTLSGIEAGTYYVTVTDNSDLRTCQAYKEITEPDAALDITNYSKKDLECFGDDDGWITISIEGGTRPPTHYAWTGPNGRTDTTQNIYNCEPGMYSVTVTDANGCTDEEENIKIIEPPALQLDIDIIDEILCNGDLTGVLEADASGGTGSISYEWDDPGHQTTKRATNLSTGKYTVTITDLNGCQEQGDETLYEPTAISISKISKSNISCNGEEDGSITVNVGGGTPTYDYEWYDSLSTLVATSKNLIDVGPNIYTLIVTDANNCQNSYTDTISEPPAISIDSVKVNDLACYGDTDGSITIYASGGTEPLRYSINGGTDYQADSVFTGLIAGDYDIAVKDANDCEKAGSTVTITEPSAIEINRVITDITCNGLSDGSIDITPSGGTGSYTFTWSHGPTTEDVSGLTAAAYTVTVEDANACTLDSIFTITEPDEITIDSEESTDISCYGEDDGTITITASGGTGVLYYTLNPDAIDFNSTGEFDTLSPGTYTVDVDDANNCGPVTSSNITITEPDSLYIDTLLLNADGSITIKALGGIKPYEYSIDGGTTFLSDSVFSDISTAQITVVVKDANGCTFSGQFTVIIEIEIYNAFTPNADDINDLWNIHGLNIMYPECTVKVYNTWGTLVFSSNGYPEPWDGTKNGTELPAGTYFYVIDLGDGSDPLTGTVNIIK